MSIFSGRERLLTDAGPGNCTNRDDRRRPEPVAEPGHHGSSRGDGSVSGQPISRRESLRDPRQACDHSTEGYSARPSTARRLGRARVNVQCNSLCGYPFFYSGGFRGRSEWEVIHLWSLLRIWFRGHAASGVLWRSLAFSGVLWCTRLTIGSLHQLCLQPRDSVARLGLSVTVAGSRASISLLCPPMRVMTRVNWTAHVVGMQRIVPMWLEVYGSASRRTKSMHMSVLAKISSMLYLHVTLFSVGAL
jgi:hypothetical protein